VLIVTAIDKEVPHDKSSCTCGLVFFS